MNKFVRLSSKHQLFLGGTCGDNHWRDDFTQRLISKGVDKSKIFNPVVPDWTPEMQKAEDKAKEESSHLLFYIANPKTKGNETSGYSLIELTMGLYDNPDKTIGVLDTSEMSEPVATALTKGFVDLKKRFPDGHIFSSLDEAVTYLTKALK